LPVVLLHGSGCLLLVAIGLVVWDGGLREEEAEGLTYPACVALVGVFAWGLWSWRHVTGRLIDPYTMFLTAAFLFNGGHALLEVLWLSPRGIMDERFSHETTLSALYLVALSLMSLHGGGLASALVRRGKRAALVPQPESFYSETRTAGWILVGVSIWPAALVLWKSATIAIQGGYFELYRQDVRTGLDSGPHILAAFLVPGALFLLAGSRSRDRFALLVSGLIILVYSAVPISLGLRSSGSMALLAYLWLWHAKGKRLPTWSTGLGIALLVFVVFPFIAATRDLSFDDRMSTAGGIENYDFMDNPPVSIIREMGSSMSTVAHTLELVPAVRDFDYGVGYLYALLTVVPSLGGGLHPTIARGLPSVWLTWTVEPHTAARGGGLGFSFIAESYLNVGWLGTPIVMATIGYLYATLILWATESRTVQVLALTAAFLSFFLFFVRQEAASQVRALLWYSLAPYCCVLMLHRFRSRATAATRARPRGSLAGPGSDDGGGRRIEKVRA